MFTVIATLPTITATAVDHDRGLIWVAQSDGSLGSVSLDGTHTLVQRLSAAAIGLSVGRRLISTDAEGRVLSFNPDDPSAPPRTVVDTGDTYGQVALSVKQRTAVVVTPVQAKRPGRPPLLNPRDLDPLDLNPLDLNPLDRRPVEGGRRSPFELRARDLRSRLASPGTLTLVDLRSGATSDLQVGGATGVAVSSVVTYVARNPLRFGGGSVGTLSGATFTAITPTLPRVGRLGLSATDETVYVAHPATAQVSAFVPSTGVVDTHSTATLAGTVLEVHGLADGRILVVTSEVLAVVDTLADLQRDPVVEPPTEPLFVGSWAPLSFDLGSTGLTAHEVHFTVPDGPDAGIVSHTRQDGAAEPTPLLVAGGAVGVHKVVMVETATGTELAHAEFEITDHWGRADVGPSGVVTTATAFTGDSGWGGGPGTPQNLNTVPHTGTWRSLVLMVDTSSGRWPAADPALANDRAAILQHVTTGFATGGATRSARDFYEENSSFVAGTSGLTLGVHNATTFGPIHLPGDWDDYFAQTVNSAGVVTDSRWGSIGTTLQTIVSRGIADGIVSRADLFAVDVLIVVVASPDATGAPPARFVWPHANDVATLLCGTNVVSDWRDLAFTYVPLDFAAHDGRHLHTTLSHELGHTLGLPDLYSFPEYSDEVDGRLTHDWDLMAGSRNHLPHYTVSNKMRMGWVDPGHLKLYNFQGSSAVAENITLHASELGAPPGGRFRAIEIRLGDGWNYYVEYRAEQPGADTDDLSPDRRVVITDVTSDAFAAPMARPPILFVRNDLDGDGRLLTTGEDFEEKDPGTQMDLRVEVVSTAADHAVVRVSYGSNGRPEPGIRPWTGGPNWQSPDIEVRNAKSLADPARYTNVPWLGHDNTVVAKVRNSGDLLARGVVVDLFAMEYTTGDGPWIPLGSPMADIAPGATTEFTARWNPPAATGRHYCLVARVRLYQDPGNPAVVDSNIYNNEARSNYTRFISASASPSSRVGAEVLLANPFAEESVVHARVEQTHPQHRLFVDHRWVTVPGKGQSPIRVWDEALWGHQEWWSGVQTAEEKRRRRSPSFLYEVPNQVSISGWAERPFEADCGSRTLTGGVGMRVDAGRETRIEVGRVNPSYVTGQVVFTDDKSGVTSGGTVLVEVVGPDGKTFTVTTEVRDEGHFGVDFNNEFGDETRFFVLHYLGSYGAAACETDEVPVR